MGWVKEFLICFSSHLIFYNLKKLIVLEVKYNLYINKYYKFIQFIFMPNKFIFYPIYVKKEKIEKKSYFLFNSIYNCSKASHNRAISKCNSSFKEILKPNPNYIYFSETHLIKGGVCNKNTCTIVGLTFRNYVLVSFALDFLVVFKFALPAYLSPFL